MSSVAWYYILCSRLLFILITGNYVSFDLVTLVIQNNVSHANITHLLNITYLYSNCVLSRALVEPGRCRWQ